MAAAIYIIYNIYIYGHPPLIRPRSVCLHYDLNAHIACIDPVEDTHLHIVASIWLPGREGLQNIGNNWKNLRKIGKPVQFPIIP